ncbi:MAG: DnaA/Hda family protein [Planctomycetia bacterium]|nr:DnaA/Hda family protein [Planctomycetia bacterium]
MPQAAAMGIKSMVASQLLDFCSEHAAQTSPKGRLRRYNPVVAVGSPGAGKTRWLTQVCARWSDKNDVPAVRWDGQSLGREIAAALYNDTIDEWRTRLVSRPLVLIDAIDRVVDPEALQMLPYLFDACAAVGRQWVVTLDRHPSMSPTLGDTLATRLCGGLLVVLPHPPPPLIRPLASATHSAQWRRVRRPSTIIRHAIAATARRYGLTPEEITGPSQRRTAAHARSIAMALVRQLTSKSLVAIGAAFGHRDHTTVLHSLRVVHDRMCKDESLASDMQALLKQLQTF